MKNGLHTMAKNTLTRKKGGKEMALTSGKGGLWVGGKKKKCKHSVGWGWRDEPVSSSWEGKKTDRQIKLDRTKTDGKSIGRVVGYIEVRVVWHRKGLLRRIDMLPGKEKKTKFRNIFAMAY